MNRKRKSDCNEKNSTSVCGEHPTKDEGAEPDALSARQYQGGVAACVANLDEGQRMATAEPLARFLTALHAIHVLGGLGGLIRVIYRLNRSILRKSTLDATSRYWHFMDVLWVYLLLLLWMKL